MIKATLDLYDRVKWVLKRHKVSIVAAVIVSLLGGWIGWAYDGGPDPVRDEVRAAVLLLRDDFGTNSSIVEGAYLRKFRGVQGDWIVGEVIRKVDSGPCWGFEIRFSGAWLRNGEGSVVVGDVTKMPEGSCTE